MTCTLISQEDGKRYVFRSEIEASKWLGRGKTYIASVLYYNCPCTHKITREKFAIETDRELFLPPDRRSKERTFQPCCHCKNFARGCEWSERFEPVPGWDAVSTLIGKDSYPIKSYKIYSCPKYKEG